MLEPKPQRLASLDAFRGITIAGMILVNNPGSWGHVYGPLGHATWNGWTPTDLIFPFFLFIVGVAMPFAMGRRLGQGMGRGRLLVQAARRSAILFALGLIMAGFPNWRLIGPYVLVVVGASLAGHARVALRLIGLAVLVGAAAYFALDFAYFDQSRLRVPGVLQRIAVCYLLATAVVLWGGQWGAALAAAACIVGYWVICKRVLPPDGYAAAVTDPGGLLHDWIDVKLLGVHIYRERPDPEGVLSTLPAVATTLLGYLAGRWLLTGRERLAQAVGLFFMANLALFAGLWMNYGFPINKKIWSSSYVVFTAGMALHFLVMCFWLIDVKRWRAWAWPFLVFGTNYIAVFFASGLLAKMTGRWKVGTPSGMVSVKQWIYEQVFASWAGPLNGSLLFALAYVVFWLLVLIPLYRLRWFIRV
jgi:predicted acyltransferase